MEALKRDSAATALLNARVADLHSQQTDNPVQRYSDAFVRRTLDEGRYFGFRAFTEDGRGITSAMLFHDSEHAQTVKDQIRLHLQSLGIDRRAQQQHSPQTQIAYAKSQYTNLLARR